MLASLHQNVAKEDVRALLEKVGLAADGDTKYRKYSLGMKQRLGIAGAILGKPELLLLDEPTNALDTKGVELLREIIERNGSGEPLSWLPAMTLLSWNLSAMRSTAWKTAS